MVKEKTVFIRRDRVMQMLGGISVSTLYRWLDRGIVPKPVKLSTTIAVWKEDEIQELVEKFADGELSA